MSYDPVYKMTLADTAAIDAFGRLRVSHPQTLLETKFTTGISPLRWAQAVSGGGSITPNTDAGTVVLAVPATPGAFARLQTRQRGIYTPGKSLTCMCTFVLGTAGADVIKRVGMFDAENGLFLRQDASGLSFGIRSSSSGTPLDTLIPRSAWDDPMDGTGPSGINLDVTRAQILFIDLEWLGVGRVRFGFVVDGVVHYAYRANHANVVTTTYMGNPNLPIRATIETASAAGSMTLICSSILSEGGVDDLGRRLSVSNGVTTRSIGATLTELIAVRLTSAAARRAMLVPDNISVHQTTVGFLYQVIVNAVGPTGGTWSAVPDALSEVNVGRTGTITGGSVILSGYASTVQDAVVTSMSPWAIGADIDGTPDIVSLAVASIGGTNQAYVGSINYQELQ